MNVLTNLISAQLGYYHIGIFLLDEPREYAILSASNSEGGKRMLATRTSLAGWTTRHGGLRNLKREAPHRSGRWSGRGFLQQSRPP